jgi:hypothetical protein
MQQAIHIFKKDVRYLRLEICLVVLLSGTLPVLWPIAAAFLIARLIHAEAIPGNNQFWVTRPYRWPSLLAAKLLFIGLFVNLPVCLYQAYVLIRYGYTFHSAWSGLIWYQILLILCLSLPAAALAALTPGMVSFGLLELLLAAIVFALSEGGTLGLPVSRAAWPTGVEWISNSLLVAAIAIAAAAILILQFRRRKTLLSRVIAASAVLAGVSLFLLLPPQFALNAEARLAPASIDARSLQMALAETRPMSSQITSPQVLIPIPIRVTGLSQGIDLKADAFSGTLQGPGGVTVQVYTNGADIYIDDSGNPVIQVHVFVEQAFYRSQFLQPLTLRGSLYLSLFGNARSQTIPQQNERVSVLDQFRCSTTEFEHLVQFGCSSMYRWPGEMLYAEIRGREAKSFFQGISYSPFPAELRVTPVEFHSALGTRGLEPPSPLGPKPPPPVTIIAKSALAHIERDIEIQGIRLSGRQVFRGSLPPPPKRAPGR